jgi:hypothetical protein
MWCHRLGFHEIKPIKKEIMMNGDYGYKMWMMNGEDDDHADDCDPYAMYHYDEMYFNPDEVEDEFGMTPLDWMHADAEFDELVSAS